MEQVSARLDMKNLGISNFSQKYSKMSFFAKVSGGVLKIIIRLSNFLRPISETFNIICY